ncbi:hypothetical protein PHYC_02971 [Phycisphaerales bacterium]|nr:hypothetical protein PHYC_02971 [Phycisphaerales bacterium]
MKNFLDVSGAAIGRAAGLVTVLFWSGVAWAQQQNTGEIPPPSPPTPSKPDDPPAVLSFLLMLLLAAGVILVNALATKRSHQD